MDHLPIELLHMICSHLPVEDILSFRYLNTVCAAVGAQYMLPAVLFEYFPESLARLKAISEHPIISQHVKTLVYSLLRLPEFTDFEQYKRNVRAPIGFTMDWPLYPPPGSNKRDHRAYQRGVKKKLGLPLSTRILKKGWDNYMQLYNNVAALQNTDTEFEIIKSAVARFPRLAMIRVQSRYQYIKFLMRGPYKKCHIYPELPDVYNELCGVKPLQNLLLGASTAGIKLQHLSAGPISWKFFDDDRQCPAQTAGTRCHLREIRLDIGMRGEYESRPGFEQQLRNRVLSFSDFCVRDFLTASPDLESMTISFEHLGGTDSFSNGIKIDRVLGGYTWGHLRRLELCGLESEEPCLLDLFQRHVKTLKHVTLEDFYLTGPPCSGVSSFEGIPKILDLDSADLRGYFFCDVLRTTHLWTTDHLHETVCVT
ncbi:hypothetical protein MMC11_003483 [Xylographa trunciseda]|nr:hypothetical protein [Xylographa trunciseda]